jgi:hypothetical protein
MSFASRNLLNEGTTKGDRADDRGGEQQVSAPADLLHMAEPAGVLLLARFF